MSEGGGRVKIEDRDFLSILTRNTIFGFISPHLLPTSTPRSFHHFQYGLKTWLFVIIIIFSLIIIIVISFSAVLLLEVFIIFNMNWKLDGTLSLDSFARRIVHILIFNRLQVNFRLSMVHQVVGKYLKSFLFLFPDLSPTFSGLALLEFHFPRLFFWTFHFPLQIGI